jgi:hypothetical protein
MQKADLSFVSVVNPFSSQLEADIQSPISQSVQIQLIDNFGKVARKESLILNTGLTHITVNNIANLAEGMYTLQVICNEATLTKKVIKH